MTTSGGEHAAVDPGPAPVRAGDQRDADADLRDLASDHRDRVATLRDKAGDERDRAAAVRDSAADLRDEAGDERDRAAALRDLSADARDLSEAQRDDAAAHRDEVADKEDTNGPVPGPGELGRRQSAADRKSSAQGRRAGANERNHAELDRDTALSDREEGARERSRADLDRESALGDRRSSGRERQRAQLDRTSALSDRQSFAVDRELAAFDGLTGAYLRHTGLALVAQEIARCRRTGTPLVLAFVDVDHLKHVNDTYGHAAGDALLVNVADALKAALRSYDLIVRYGGDEFVCVVSGLRSDGVADRLAWVDATLAASARPGSVTVGLAELEPGESVSDLLGRADAALYAHRNAARAHTDAQDLVQD